MRKYKYLKIQAFRNILCKAEIHAILKVLDAVDSYSTEKVWEKKQTFQNQVFLNISCKAIIHAIPKPWDE